MTAREIVEEKIILILTANPSDTAQMRLGNKAIASMRTMRWEYRTTDQITNLPLTDICLE
ncbi:hypothetical protein [cf. Phormidesmis sp. LEGE 11477]|uniref:hypothetical protein n=1 Tax=cf. Phormidesmis sp. LEGE 11477 TaxID=1828680 RepID=UPI0018823883|nr:hypothetical protein [cf. Phormidesmis sp. LEGE 11477]MBE9060584.1 hypothetical protein [cf. Phormidesmis sp. LEGE 11477]